MLAKPLQKPYHTPLTFDEPVHHKIQCKNDTTSPPVCNLYLIRVRIAPWLALTPSPRLIVCSTPAPTDPYLLSSTGEI